MRRTEKIAAPSSSVSFISAIIREESKAVNSKRREGAKAQRKAGGQRQGGRLGGLRAPIYLFFAVFAPLRLCVFCFSGLFKRQIWPSRKVRTSQPSWVTR